MNTRISNADLRAPPAKSIVSAPAPNTTPIIDSRARLPLTDLSSPRSGPTAPLLNSIQLALVLRGLEHGEPSLISLLTLQIYHTMTSSLRMINGSLEFNSPRTYPVPPLTRRRISSRPLYTLPSLRSYESSTETSSFASFPATAFAPTPSRMTN